MVHGLLRRSLNFYSLGKKVRQHGYHVYLYDYPTTRYPVWQHGSHLRLYLEKIARCHPGSKIHLVTHSMGAILTREALRHLDPHYAAENSLLMPDRIGQIIMLAPPNSGSDVARFFCRYLPIAARWIKPLADLSSAPESYIHQVPRPAGINIGVIIARFDREVKAEYTILPEVRHYLTVNSEHSLIMYLPSTGRAVIDFLKYGRFNP